MVVVFLLMLTTSGGLGHVSGSQCREAVEVERVFLTMFTSVQFDSVLTALLKGISHHVHVSAT